MARRRTSKATGDEVATYPSDAERKGMRAHDDQGNVRPADGRWDLHQPKDESKYVKAQPPADEEPEDS